MGCVYLLTSPKGKQYVGMTTNTLSYRWYYHKYWAERQLSNGPLQRAIRKYGHESFSVEVLHESSDEQELFRLEVAEIASRKTLAPNGYNLTEGGEGGKHCAVVRERLSEHNRRTWADPEIRKRRSVGIAKAHADPGYRERLSKSVSLSRTPEVRSRIGASNAATRLLQSDKDSRAAKMRLSSPSVFWDGAVYANVKEAAQFLKVSYFFVYDECRLSRSTWRFKLPNHRDPECDAVEECWALMQWAAANPDHADVPDWLRS